MTTAGQAGRIEQVDVRDKWPNEALDFTPWLSENLDLLGNALGMKFELVRTEAPVGGPPYYLDILAKETTKDVLVAIENQLEWSDFSHLAQILTYSAGLGARIAIWVAPEFRYESAEVLNWLNECASDDKVQFYGVKVEVVKTSDSSHKAIFHKVVSPGCWSKEMTLPSVPPMDPRTQQFYDFFQPLIADLRRTGFAYSARQLFDSSGRGFPSGLHKGILYAASLEGKNDAWATLHISMENNELTKQIFDTLEEDRAQIECNLDADWHWYRHSGSSFSSINVRSDGSIDDPPEKLEETRARMLDMLPKLKAIFNPRLERILSELPATDKG